MFFAGPLTESFRFWFNLYTNVMFVASGTNPTLYSEDILNLILLEALPIGRLFCCSILIMGVNTCLADACRHMVIDVRCHMLASSNIWATAWGFTSSYSMFLPQKAWTQPLRVICAACLRVSQSHRCSMTKDSSYFQQIKRWLLHLSVVFELGADVTMASGVYSPVTLEAARPTTAWKTQCLSPSSWKMPTSASFVSSASTRMVVKRHFRINENE